MYIKYETRKDCNLSMAAYYAKAVLSLLGLGISAGMKEDTKAKTIIKLVGGGLCAGFLFRNAAQYGQVLQIRDTCFPKEGK